MDGRTVTNPPIRRPSVSAVVVTFHSSAWCGAAIASVRREAARAGTDVEVVVVDHSEDAAEADRLREMRPDRLVTQANRGFAAGVNAGIAQATGAVVALVNPDVELHEGALERLLGALDAGWDVVGPQLELANFLFPRADEQTPTEQVRRFLAGRRIATWRRRLDRELAANRVAWESAEPVDVPALSGACLVFRRELADRVGRWDEGYFLYFEETDWLRRVRRAGGRLAVVPGALARHEWGHAADPAAALPHFLASRRRFLARHHPLLGRLVTLVSPGPAPLEPAEFPPSYPRGEGRIWWLLSPTPLGLPGAGLAGTWADLVSALDRLARGRPQPWTYLLSGVDRDGGLLGPWRWRVGNG
jgi:GT2 family glycosyltransferase